MSVQNPNRVVTKQDLADFYEDILPYLGGMPEMLANKFSKGDLYSTDEKMIGQWIDGKPLYQKTFSIPSQSSDSANYTLSNYIQNADVITNIDGMLPSVGVEVGYYWSSNNLLTVQAVASENIFSVLAPTQKANFPLVLTFKYTKSTDSAISIGSDTDYSTTEKIVGTWIDGKPIYQKTVDCGALPNNASKAIPINITNLDIIVDMTGMAVSHSDMEFKPLTYVSGSSYDNYHGISFSVDSLDNTPQIKIVTNVNRSNLYGYATIRYTKTSS